MNTAKIKSWIAAHHTEAYGGGAVVGVAVLALYMRHRNAAAAAAGTAGTAATGIAAEQSTAGLAGYPNTLATDLQNQVQDMLNSQNDYLNQRLAALTPPASAPTVGANPGTGVTRSQQLMADYRYDLMARSKAIAQNRKTPTPALRKLINTYTVNAKKALGGYYWLQQHTPATPAATTTSTSTTSTSSK
jgi:hypothetical protein